MTIAIPGWLVGPNSFGVTIPYIEFARDYLNADDIRILQPDSPIWTDLDLLMLPGGADINPSRYGEMPGFYTDKPDILKEYFDVHVLPRYIENKTPVLGLCRGAQSIGVHFGAHLIQNMYHETNKQENPYEGVHGIKVLSDPNSKHKIKVNSRHHQSIRRPVGDSPIIVLATHSAFAHHVEAIRIRDYPIIGLQFHSEDCEESSCLDYTMSLIKTILK
jgi:putative glutamine amidotransferase